MNAYSIPRMLDARKHWHEQSRDLYPPRVYKTALDLRLQNLSTTLAGCLFPSLHVNHPPSVVIFSFQTEYNMTRLQLCSAHIIIYNHIRQRLLPKLESACYQNATAAIIHGGPLFQMANLICHMTLLFDFISKTFKFEKYFTLLPRSKGLS